VVKFKGKGFIRSGGLHKKGSLRKKKPALNGGLENINPLRELLFENKKKAVTKSFFVMRSDAPPGQ
jgi:hypothetical protein